MANIFIDVDDLRAFDAKIPADKASQMIEDAEALAKLAAPCLKDPEFQQDETYRGAVKAVLRSAILRWNDSGTGAISQVGAGGFNLTTDNRTPRKSMFWPSEIAQLRELCSQFAGEGKRQAFAVDTAPGGGTAHLPWCSGMMAAAYCSCGADIAGHPIYGKGRPA